MRLTLRTLLGWLDGVLPPEDHAFIGERVGGSRVATRLADRIRGAVVRPGIGVPSCGGQWLADDPNFVAEYLDNTLSAAHVEAFERVCLDSEIHLAEVAACHGLLAELARDRQTERTLKYQEHAGLKDRAQRLLVWARVQKAGDGVAAAETRARESAARESQETARALVRAIANESSPVSESASPSVAAVAAAAAAAAPAAVAAVTGWRPGAVGELIAQGLRGVEAVAAAVPMPAPADTESPADGAESGGRGSFLTWVTAGFALTLVLALGGALASSMNTSRAFEPEAGCFRCTEP